MTLSESGNPSLADNMASIDQSATGLKTSKRTPADLPGVRIPIRLKIILPYLLLSMALAVGAAFVITRIVFDSLEERFTNQLVESGKLASEWMYREEERMLANIRLLANAGGVPEAIAAHQAEELRRLTLGIVVDNRSEAVEFLDARGYLVLSMRHRPGGDLEEYVFVKNGDQSFLDADFVRKVVKQQADGFSDKYSGLLRNEAGTFFYIASPVFDTAGQQAGTLLLGKSLPALARQMREETLAQVTLYGLSGSVLHSTFQQGQALPEALAAQALAYQDTGSIHRELQVSNIDYQELLGSWEVRDNVDIGVLGVSLPKSFYVEPEPVTRFQIGLLVSLAFLFVILMGVQLARIITRPLLRLMQASAQVSNGDLGVQVLPQSNDEVAVLTVAFNQMVQKLQISRNALLNAYDSTLEGWSKALELRDKETNGHTLRVAEMTVELARRMGLSEEALVQLHRGALLHDIGKMGIPDQILLKPGKLTDEEWVIMRRHTQHARDMLWPIEYLRPALDIPYYHHERWNGSGYPNGLRGEEIPLAARIFAVVDVWDAMTSERPYKEALPAQEALALIVAERGVLFDPRVVDAFAAYMNGQIPS